MDMLLSWVNSGAAVVVVIGLCLFCHELGHFLAAKACGMAVYEFAMGFGPILWKRRRGETLYALRAIPFGGFVRIAGMEPGEPPVERGFHSRPRWQGAIVICAGTFMNLVLAVAVYWVVNCAFGVPVPDSQDVFIKDVFPNTAAEAAGFRPGDKIIGINGGRQSAHVLTVKPGSLADKMGLRPHTLVFQIGSDPVATPADILRLLKRGVPAGAKVWVADLQAKGIEDTIVALDPPPPQAFQAVPAELDGALAERLAPQILGVTFDTLDQTAIHRFISAHANTPIIVTVLRHGQPVTLRVTPRAQTDRFEMVDQTGRLTMPHRQVGRIGIALGPEVRRMGPVEGFTFAVQRSWSAVVTVVTSVRAMVLRKVAAELSSPIGIMATTAETAKLGWGPVLSLCGLVSANLALLNMFPFPPFDGFHVVLLGVEAIIRRRVDHRLEMLVRLTGFGLILGLFTFLALKDILTLVRFGTY